MGIVNFLRGLVGRQQEPQQGKQAEGIGEDYRGFVRDLLRAKRESGSDVIAVVYSLLDQRRHLLNPRFIEALQQEAERLIAASPASSQSILGDIVNLSIDIRNFPRGSRANNIEIAIAGYEIVLSNREPGSEKYAQTQNNLANAYQERINGSRAENLERAIEYYQAALTVRTREDFPEDWAMTQNNLAVAYRNRINGSRAENLERAIEYYQAALTVRTREDFPEYWATTQNNLANAYSNRINGSRAKNLERAIEYYQAALTVYTPEDFPEYWATTQNNLAVAYQERINGSRAENLERAIEYFLAALTVRTRKDFPQYWADTQNNLAAAYSQRINGSRAENLEWAIEYYQAALTVYTREDFPEYWADTQNNLANAYSERINGSRAENLEWAIEYYQAALTVRTFEDFPLNNVLTLDNLGLAYLAKLDHLKQSQPLDHQQTVTLQSAYDTLLAALRGATVLRQLESGNEAKEKHDLQWDRLYQGMVQVCLERGSDQEALEYAEANKARNLGELIAQRRPEAQPPAPITFAQITQLLTTPTTALIEWYITNQEIVTFIVTRDELTVHRCPKQKELENLVIEYKKDYQNKDLWLKKLPTYLQRLGEILAIPAILPPGCNKLILIPHWYLHLFPLHALPLDDEQHLLDRFPQGIQYAPSCQLLYQIQPQSHFTQLIALQNPTEDLTYTDLEVASIASNFSLSHVLPGKQATKTNLLENYLTQLQNAHCAHFSCHGFFDSESPLRSALVLSGGIILDTPSTPEAGETPSTPPQKEGTGEEEPNRYVQWRTGKTADTAQCLTLAEILELQFQNCRLAVLSACETGLIDTTNRSDYIGLPTGFLHAGAMGVLASLWQVNDISTALLMVKFYELLTPNTSISLALHQAQLWFKSATTKTLQTWVKDSPSFSAKQKEDIETQLDGYGSEEKPYNEIHHWAAFCAIGL